MKKHVRLGEISNPADISRFAALLAPKFAEVCWRWGGHGSHRRIPDAADIERSILGTMASALKGQDGDAASSGGLTVEIEGGLPVLKVDPKLNPLLAQAIPEEVKRD